MTVVDAAPFRALRYDPKVAGEPATTSAPAYDELERFAYATHRAASPYTVLDLIAPGNGYAAAAATLDRWRRTGVLATDPDPAFYRYEQHELRRGVPRVQRGVLAAVRLPELGTSEVLAHEDVDADRVAARLVRLEAVPIEVSPVYGFAVDPPPGFRGVLAQAPERSPVAAFTDAAGVDHRVWRIVDPGTIAAIRHSLTGVRVVIADGHHRFAAALAARDRRREKAPADHSGETPWDRALMYIVDGAEAGPEIRAIHRLASELPDDVFERLRRTCHVTAAGRDARRLADLLPELRGRVFGLYLAGGPPTAWLVRPRDDAALAAELPRRRSARWRALDAAILDHALLPRLSDERSGISYRADVEAAAAEVDSGAAAGLFLLRPVSLDAVSTLAAAGEPMPPKTTHFRPKPRVGLVMRSLGEG